MKKKGNGFTLVEILATIIVLAVISLISVPIVLNLIENSRKNVLMETAKGLIESAKYYYNSNASKMTNENVEFIIENNKIVTDEKLNFKGKADNAFVLLFPDGEVALCVDDNKYSAVKPADSNEITIDESICTGEFEESIREFITSSTRNFGEFTLKIKAYTSIENMPSKAVNNELAVITDKKITGYFVGYKEPLRPVEGMIWVVSKITTGTDFKNPKSIIPINYCVQYIDGEWIIKDSYLYDGDRKEWIRLEFYDKSDYVYNYEYTGHYEEFTAPHTGTYQIELWGGSGGNVDATYVGGLGAYTKGEIYLTEGEKLYVYVGQGGVKAGASAYANTWNGGGKGYSNSGAGGGATDVRLVKTSSETTWNEFNSLKSRIMVAAGGGGGANYSTNLYSSIGGAGGALGGGDNINKGTQNLKSYLGTGASQTTAGMASSNANTKGGFGYGGNAVVTNSAYRNGGGGSGYYGGGGGTSVAGGGGGGSSYISGYKGCNSIDENNSETEATIMHTGNEVHSSGKKFDNGVMEPGVNSGNGRATITFKAFGEYNPKPQKMNVGDSVVYNFVGGYEAFHVNTTGTYKIEAWGASGDTDSASFPAGKGAYTKGDIYLEAGDTIYIFVGGRGYISGGGYNGGGHGWKGGGGGGATDIRVNVNSGSWNDFNSLKNRIMVAAGGGGGANYGSNYGSTGGAGGIIGLTAQSLINGPTHQSHLGTGATQTDPGIASGNANTKGGFGYGGDMYKTNDAYKNGGGGGGYYGGGGGTSVSGAGGGGSSYISGHNGCNAIRESSTSSNIVHLGVSEHYTGYKFKNTEIKTGINEGNGKVLITLISKDEPTEVNEVKDIYTFEYDGSYVPFKIPKKGYYQVELWGAQGGTYDATAIGGYGAYTKGVIYFEKGTKLIVYVGGQSTGQMGGYNGGGNAEMRGSGGGGATDIRIIAGSSNQAASYASRIMVAAGGGGGANYGSGYTSAGGSGGGLIGYNTNKIGTANLNISNGATQIAAGLYGTNANTKGGFGYGGNSVRNNDVYQAGGGGAGWYGGGGGIGAGGAGAGGSSYISGHAGCIATDNQGNPKTETYSTISDSYSNTGYKFTDTVMIDGQGYKWTTEKSSTSTGMPDYDGVNVKTGNEGNGFAKFTYLGE